MRWLTCLLGTRHSPYAKGGTLPARPGTGGDQVPAILSTCGYTLRRAGDTWAQATDRLTHGEP